MTKPTNWSRPPKLALNRLLRQIREAPTQVDLAKVIQSHGGMTVLKVNRQVLMAAVTRYRDAPPGDIDQI